MAKQNELSQKGKHTCVQSHKENDRSSDKSQKSLGREQNTPRMKLGKGKSDERHSLVNIDQCDMTKKKSKMKLKKKVHEVQPRDEKLLKKKALKYLKLWQKDRSNWKFEKLRQIWLLQNMFDPNKVPEKKFPVLLDYLLGAKGRARAFIRERALQVVETMEQWTEEANLGLEDAEILAKNPNLQKVSENSYNRARCTLQSLREETDV